MVIPIILSGGSGTRMWPLSRAEYPKQFLPLNSSSSLIQETLSRIPEAYEESIVVCNEAHRFLVAEQVRQISKDIDSIILEPEGRNTAPAITIATLKAKQKNKDALILVMSSDHFIGNIDQFQSALKKGEKLAANDKLVTFGAKVEYAETGYGYIKKGEEITDSSFFIDSFKEKPSIEDARTFQESGMFLWNSGIFMFKASLFLEELKKFEPNILNNCVKAFNLKNKDNDFFRIDANSFKKCKNISVDYAVMEKTLKGAVVELSSGWSDIGSWGSLWSLKKKDKSGNVLSGDIYVKDVQNSYINSTNRLCAVVGISNVVVVETKDAVLVINKKLSQEIKNIVSDLKESGRTEPYFHKKIYRPWGYFESIEHSQGFQVKKISVNPFAKLSLQKHKYRSEHWIVVKGDAYITCGDKNFFLNENQSTYIPRGEIHRLENKSEFPLEIIEIQTGEYLGEDDIIRIEDDYSRS